jgi:hypothetical protein
MLTSGQPPEPLWVFSCGDRRTLDAVAHWCEVRRAYWDIWGKIAETFGREKFAEYMEKVFEEEPIGIVKAFIVQKESNPTIVLLVEMLHTSQGLRDEVLYRHRSVRPSCGTDSSNGWEGM